MCAVQAIAAASNIWQIPKAIRGDIVPRARNDPTLLPIPSPTRNTAKMIENVYTVPPSISETSRVQTTSAPSADMPDNAIATYTPHAPDARAVRLCAASSAGARCGDSLARLKAINVTVALIAAAAYVAVGMS